MVFCNVNTDVLNLHLKLVTILILIDGFLQFEKEMEDAVFNTGHNPYFNRWFSAIIKTRDYVDLKNKSQSLF